MTLVVLGISFDDESLIVVIVFFKHLGERRLSSIQRILISLIFSFLDDFEVYFGYYVIWGSVCGVFK